MRIIVANNVNPAYDMGLAMLLKEGIKESSRAGDVLVMPFPVTTCYVNPMQRVLFDVVRDANPFFHLFEALWMLAGRRDATWLDQFVKDFSKRYAETGGDQHGAYGHRWRHHFTASSEPREGWGTDQLAVVIRRLKKDWTDRRVVIQMWNPEVDLDADKLDVPCNLCVLPRVVTEPNDTLERPPRLDITVMCRSNDAVWGAYGANAVHFAFLQEYLAAMIGVEPGHYYQHSNNFHVYTNVLDKVKVGGPIRDPYHTQDFGPKMTVHPLVAKPETFDLELDHFMRGGEAENYANSFFTNIAVPMRRAHNAFKQGDWTFAFDQLALMPPTNDWYRAAHAWMLRRYEKALPAKKPRFSEGRPGGLLG